MPSPAVKALVEAEFNTWPNRTAAPLTNVNDVGEGVNFFTEISYPVANENFASIGTPVLCREQGVIRFTVHAIKLSGVDDALAYAEELRDLFRNRDLGAMTTYEASPPAFEESNKRGPWYQVPIVVTYDYDVTK